MCKYNHSKHAVAWIARLNGVELLLGTIWLIVCAYSERPYGIWQALSGVWSGLGGSMAVLTPVHVYNNSVLVSGW